MTGESMHVSIGWTSWLRWFAVTFLGLVAGLAVFFLFGVTLGEYVDATFPPFLFGVVLGTIFGTAFGIAHSRFLRRYIPGVAGWVPATAVAFALASAVIFGLLTPEDVELPALLRIGHATVAGLFLGSAQWLVLRSRISGPTPLWIIFSVGAWILGELAGIGLDRLQVGPPLPLMTTFLVGASLSGIGMIWLLSQHFQLHKRERAGMELTIKHASAS